MIDEEGRVVCERCNHYMQIGEHPFCPHGSGTAVPFRDEIPGGVVLENYGKHPIRFDSHSERRRYMGLHGLQEREKFAPFPGTDRDPAGIQNPMGYVDQKTMDNARELICRNGKKTAEWDAEKAGVLTNLDVHEMTVEEAIEVQRASQ